MRHNDAFPRVHHSYTRSALIFYLRNAAPRGGAWCCALPLRTSVTCFHAPPTVVNWRVIPGRRSIFDVGFS